MAASLIQTAFKLYLWAERAVCLQPSSAIFSLVSQIDWEPGRQDKATEYLRGGG